MSYVIEGHVPKAHQKPNPSNYNLEGKFKDMEEKMEGKMNDKLKSQGELRLSI